MWQSNVSDFPQRVFKASSLRNLLKFLIKWSFMNWQMYMRSIYWQAMPTVKKKNDKQRQRLYKVGKRYERATNEKEVQAKHVLKNRAYRVDVHVLYNNLVFAATYVFFRCLKLSQADNHVEEFLINFYPSALRAGGVLSSRSGRAGGRAGGCQTCGTHISVTAWWIFSVGSSMELSRPVVVHCHAHLPICPIWACPWAENLSNLPQIGSRLCGSHISETAGWIYPI